MCSGLADQGEKSFNLIYSKQKILLFILYILGISVVSAGRHSKFTSELAA